MRSLPAGWELYRTTRTRPSGYCAGCGKFTQLDPAQAECADCILAWYAAHTDASTRT